MSIGLLTFHRQLNYGGVLQALALHDMLEKESGQTVETIDLWMDPRDAALLGKVHNPHVPFHARLRNRLRARRKPFGQEAFEIRRERTIQLLETRLHLSAEHYRHAEDLHRLKPYDTVVVGSDQVWNYDLLAYLKRNPWLGNDFPEGQDVIAYAASYGVTSIPPALIPEYQRAFKRYRAITVREASGCALHEQLTGTRPPLVMDPTLLPTRAYWEAQTAAFPPAEEPYLLCYWLDGLSPERIAWMQHLAQTAGKHVVLLVSGPMSWDPAVAGITPRFDVDPLEFVALIAHADGVFADSFHALLFSAIFRKKAAFFVSQETGGTSASSRFYDFCARYQRLPACHAIETLHEASLDALQDFSLLDEVRFNQDREASLACLRAMLKRP